MVGTAKCCLLQGACVGNGRGPPAVANERLHRFRKRWVWATRVGGSGPTSVGRCPALQEDVGWKVKERNTSVEVGFRSDR